MYYEKGILPCYHWMNSLPRMPLYSKKAKEKLVEINIAVLGDNYVGNTSLIRRFVEDYFHPSDEYDPTIIEDKFRKQYKINNQTVLVNIMDTTKRVHASNGTLFDIILDSSKFFLVLFACNNKKSFDEVSAIRHEIYG